MSPDAQQTRGHEEMSLDEELSRSIVRAAKSCDPFTASRLLRDAIAAGELPGALSFGAAVIACTNVRDLAGAEAWLDVMIFCGHSIPKSLVHTMTTTALDYTPHRRWAEIDGELGPTPTLEDVGAWLRRLHMAGRIPMSADIANEVVRRLGVYEMVPEACVWASIACGLAMRELAGCDDTEFDDLARRRGVVLLRNGEVSARHGVRPNPFAGARSILGRA